MLCFATVLVVGVWGVNCNNIGKCYAEPNDSRPTNAGNQQKNVRYIRCLERLVGDMKACANNWKWWALHNEWWRNWNVYGETNSRLNSVQGQINAVGNELNRAKNAAAVEQQTDLTALNGLNNKIHATDVRMQSDLGNADVDVHNVNADTTNLVVNQGTSELPASGEDALSNADFVAQVIDLTNKWSQDILNQMAALGPDAEQKATEIEQVNLGQLDKLHGTAVADVEDLDAAKTEQATEATKLASVKRWLDGRVDMLASNPKSSAESHALNNTIWGLKEGTKEAKHLIKGVLKMFKNETKNHDQDLKAIVKDFAGNLSLPVDDGVATVLEMAKSTEAAIDAKLEKETEESTMWKDKFSDEADTATGAFGTTALEQKAVGLAESHAVDVFRSRETAQGFKLRDWRQELYAAMEQRSTEAIEQVQDAAAPIFAQLKAKGELLKGENTHAVSEVEKAAQESVAAETSKVSADVKVLDDSLRSLQLNQTNAFAQMGNTKSAMGLLATKLQAAKKMGGEMLQMGEDVKAEAAKKYSEGSAAQQDQLAAVTAAALGNAAKVQEMMRLAQDSLAKEGQKLGDKTVVDANSMLEQIKKQTKAFKEKLNSLKSSMLVGEGDIKGAMSGLQGSTKKLKQFSTTLRMDAASLKESAQDDTLQTDALGGEVQEFVEHRFAESGRGMDELISDSEATASAVLSNLFDRARADAVKVQAELKEAVNSTIETRAQTTADQRRLQQEIGTTVAGMNVLAASGSEGQEEKIALLANDTQRAKEMVAATRQAKVDTAEKAARRVAVAFWGQLESVVKARGGEAARAATEALKLAKAAQARAPGTQSAGAMDGQALAAIRSAAEQTGVLESLTTSGLGSAAAASARQASEAAGQTLQNLGVAAGNVVAQGENEAGQTKQAVGQFMHAEEARTAELRRAEHTFEQDFSTAERSGNTQALKHAQEQAGHVTAEMDDGLGREAGHVEAASGAVAASAASMAGVVADQAGNLEGSLRGQEETLAQEEKSEGQSDAAVESELGQAEQELEEGDEVGEMTEEKTKHASESEIRSLDGTGQSIEEARKIHRLEQESERSAEETAELGKDEAREAGSLGSSAEAALEKAKGRVFPLITQLQEVKASGSETNQELGSEFSHDEIVLGTELGDLHGKTTALKQHVEERQQSVLAQVDKVQNQVKDAASAQAYSSQEAMGRVVKAIDAQIALDRNLSAKLRTVVDPPATEWESKVQRVFKALGMELELDKVAANTEEVGQEREIVRELMGDAESEIDAHVVNVTHSSRTKFEGSKAAALAAMGKAVAAADDQTADDEATVKTALDGVEKKLSAHLAASRAVKKSQGEDLLDLDRQRQLLRNLVERAKMAASGGAFSPPSLADLESEVSELRSGLEKLGGRVEGSSLAELREGSPRLVGSAQVRESQLRQEPAAEAATAAAQLHSTFAARTKQDAELEGWLDAHSL